jgi:hypothetical protein
VVILFLDFIGLADECILSQFALALQLNYFLHIFCQFLALAATADVVTLRLFADLSV